MDKDAAGVSRLQSKLTKAVLKGNDERAVDILNVLDGIDMKVAVLQKTNIGKTVGKLRKNSSPNISSKAKALVTKWKEVVKAALLQDNSKKEKKPSSEDAKSTPSEPVKDADFSLPLDQFLAQSDLSLPAFPSLVYGDKQMDGRRVRELNGQKFHNRGGPVIYWMQRDQRLHDNHALLHAQELAITEETPLVIVFNLVPTFLGATKRQYGFMLRGLKLIEEDCKALNIGFKLLLGKPEFKVPEFVRESQASAVVCDFSPLRVSRQWKKAVAEELADDGVSMFEVDAHNIAPCWHVSDKCEFAAKTLRGKIHKAMVPFLKEIQKLKMHPFQWDQLTQGTDWEACLQSLSIDDSVDEVTWLQPGERAAHKMLRGFLSRIGAYDKDRNNPCIRSGTSNLSPYLHFGQISSQRIVLELKRQLNCTINHLFTDERTTGPQAFCEELVVRKELSDNFCFYNENYDNIDGCHAWAKATIEESKDDPREHIYSIEQFEQAKTHEDLWNAAQLELVQRGKLHGFMRMYWAKKILEWTPDVKEALRIAIYLNDRYSLDGRDPSGYVGCMWAIGGVHDRAWTKRPIFGKIRYMNYNGCKRKFDVGTYVNKNRRRGQPKKDTPETVEKNKRKALSS
mmetsp:Transcript_35784/g.47233  ORF Transcript_35784/g.47233 Transcript_35784/m.47233 type:complete len:624 (-) Transcript_35784:222-2093(-)